jgi:O-antigen ligase
MLLRLAPCLLVLPVAWAALQDRRALTLVVAAMVFGAIVALLADPIAPERADISTIGLEASRRIGGIVGDPNELAAILLPALALAVGLFIVGPRGSWRALAAAAAACCGLGLLLTVSRGGLVAGAMMIVVAVATGGRSRRRLAVGAVGLIVAGVAWFAVFAPSAARDHLTIADRGAGRAGLWEISLRMLEDRPVTGVGLGSFREAGPAYVVRPGAIRSDLVISTPELAHNTFLQFATELGVVGLALFLAIAATCVASAVRVYRRASGAGDRYFAVMARAVLAAQAGVLTAGFFFSYTVGKPLWLVLALGPGLLAATRAERGPAELVRPA